MILGFKLLVFRSFFLDDSVCDTIYYVVVQVAGIIVPLALAVERVGLQDLHGETIVLSALAVERVALPNFYAEIVSLLVPAAAQRAVLQNLYVEKVSHQYSKDPVLVLLVGYGQFKTIDCSMEWHRLKDGRRGRDCHRLTLFHKLSIPNSQVSTEYPFLLDDSD